MMDEVGNGESLIGLEAREKGVLLRIGDRPFIEDFVSRGVLYMKTLSVFRGIEDDEVRGDPDEGTKFTEIVRGVPVAVHGQEGESGIVLDGAMLLRDPDAEFTNVFCMTVVSGRTTEAELSDLRFQKFGESIAIVHDVLQFRDRLVRVLDTGNRNYRTNFVKYVDRETYSGEMGAFRKFSNFAWQREWRIALFHGTGEHSKVELGDLSDICSIHRTCEIGTVFGFQNPENS